MNLPNKLTIIRILLVPVMVIISLIPIPGNVYGIPIQMLIIDLIFIVAAITDKLDGYLARKNNQVTTFGKFLDPIADKIIVVAAMIMLVGMQKLPAWIPIIVVFREFLISGYRLIAVQSNGTVIAANIWGKVKTATQMTAIIIMFLDVNGYASCFAGTIHDGFIYIFNLIATMLMTISVIATIFSGYEYLKGGKELFKNSK